MGQEHNKKNHISLIEKVLLGNRIYEAMTLFPGKRADEVGKILLARLGKKMLATIALLVVPALGVLLLSVGKKQPNPFELTRNNFNGADKNIQLKLNDGEKNRVIAFKLSAIQLTDEEIDLIHEKVEENLDRIVPADNASFDEIENDLFFPEGIADYPVKLTWSTDNIKLVNYKGEVKNDELETVESIVICAKVSYGKEFRLYERVGNVVPRKITQEEQLVREAVNKLQEKEAANRNLDKFLLPDFVDGFTVIPEDRKNIPGWVGALFLLLLGPAVSVAGFRSKIGEEKKKRLRQAESEYRDFISKLILFLSAGMALRPAWLRLAGDYPPEEKGNLLAESLAVSKREMETGVPESEVFEAFAERMELAMYKRLMSLLIRANTKGINDLSELLEGERSEMSAGEKEKIVTRGENAGTKLLMPMMGLLIVVFAIILVPAFMSM